MSASLPCGADVGRLPPVGLNTVYLSQVLESGAQVKPLSSEDHNAGIYTAPPFSSPLPSPIPPPLRFLKVEKGPEKHHFGFLWLGRKSQWGSEPFLRSQGTGTWQTVPENGLLWDHAAQPWAVGEWLKAFREAPLLGIDGVWGEGGAGGWV